MLQDLRYAVRTLRKAPAFTIVASLTLAVGIGSTSAIYSLVSAVMLRPLPVRNPEELVLVRAGGQYPVFKSFQSQTDIFTDLLATSGVTALDLEVQPGIRERADVSLVSGSFFSTLGIQAAIGRTFGAADDRIPGGHPIAVASDGYWRRRFGHDPTIVDRTVRVGGTPITIIGVTPPGFFGEQVGVAPDLWIPLTMWGQVVPGRNVLENPGTSWLRMIGRLRPGINESAAQSRLTVMFREIVTGIFGPRAADDVRRDIANARVTFEPAARGLSALRAEFARPLQLLMGAVVLVLLIACANIANLLLARATARRREIDLRLALGVSRPRLIRQMLTESIVLAGIGGVLGIGIAWLGTEALLRLIAPDGSRVQVAVTADSRMLAVVAIVSMATAILFGLAPAWQSSHANIVASLVARRTGSGPNRRLSAILVVAQVAISIILLTGAGLFLRTLSNLRGVDLGFDLEQLIVVDVNPSAAGYRGEGATALSRTLLERMKAVAGVSAASLAENGLLAGRESGSNMIRPMGFASGPDGFPRTRWDVVGPHYFSTIGTRLLAGREFTERDGSGSPLVVAINEAMARKFYGGADPIGQRLVWGAGENPKQLQIVAVTRDAKQSGPREEPQLRFYIPYLQLQSIVPSWVPASIHFFVRTTASPSVMAPVLRQLVPAQDPRLSVTSLETGETLFSRTLVRERTVATLLVAFGGVAIGLACLGLYGLIAYHAVQRTSEIGIRMALGARRGSVVWMILRQALGWIAAGMAAGVPAAVIASRAAGSLLFGLSAAEPRVLAGSAAFVCAMGLLAAWLPARRASKVDPLVALRT
jgi:predicted permease